MNLENTKLLQNSMSNSVWKKVTSIFMSLFFFFSVSSFAEEEPLVSENSEATTGVIAEENIYAAASSDAGTPEYSYYNNYIIVPIKWVGDVVIEAIIILTPIKGVDAANTAEDAKKYVEEALRLSNENIKKNSNAYAEGLQAAYKGMAMQQEIRAALAGSPGFQQALAESNNLFNSAQQKMLNNNALRLFNTNSQQIKEYYSKNPSALKIVFEKILNSDLAQELKDKAKTLLDILNINTPNLNQQEMMELLGGAIAGGGAAYVICEAGCTLMSAAAVGVSTGGAGTLAGLARGIAECKTLCAMLGRTSAAAVGAGVGLQSMHFREGKVKSSSQQVQEGKVGENIDEVAKKIANGHAFNKHIKDFPSFKTKEDLAQHVKKVMQDKSYFSEDLE